MSDPANGAKSRLFSRPKALLVDDRSSQIVLPPPPPIAMSFPAPEPEPTLVLPPRGMPVRGGDPELGEPGVPPDEEPEQGPARLFIGPPRVSTPRGVSVGIDAAPPTNVDEVEPSGDWEERLRWAGLDRSARTVAEDRDAERSRPRPPGALPEAARRGVMGQGPAGARPAASTAHGRPDPGHDGNVNPFLAQNPAEAARLRLAASALRASGPLAGGLGAPGAAATPVEGEAPRAKAPARSLAELRNAAVATSPPAAVPAALPPAAVAAPPPVPASAAAPPSPEPRAPQVAAPAPPPLPPSGGAAARLRHRGHTPPASGLPDPTAAAAEVVAAPAAAPAARAPAPKPANPSAGKQAAFVPRNQRPSRSSKSRVAPHVWTFAGLGLLAFAIAVVWWRIRPVVEEEDAVPAAPSSEIAAPPPVVEAPASPPEALPPEPLVPEGTVALDPLLPPADPGLPDVAAPVAAPVTPAPSPPAPAATPPASKPEAPLVVTVPPPTVPAPTQPDPAAAVTPPVPSAILTPGKGGAQAAESPGLLRITTDTRARVQIGKKSVGNVDASGEFSLPPGEHRVRGTAIRTGKSQVMMVRIDPGRTTAVSFLLK